MTNRKHKKKNKTVWNVRKGENKTVWNRCGKSQAKAATGQTKQLKRLGQYCE